MSKRNIIHVEIPAADQAAAGKFYQELFGWKMTAIPEMNYTMWESTDAASSGGFPSVSEENPVGQVTVYIDSEDIEADLKKVEKLGGKVIHPKAEVPGFGWYGLFKDPTGNVLAVYTSMNPR